MNRSAQALVLGAIGAATCIGVAVLYRLRLSRGDVFPAYSSLRADPLGTRALYEGLAGLPGFDVERRFQTLERLGTRSPRTIIVAGLESDWWTSLSTDEFNALDHAARGGSRVVLAFHADFEPRRGSTVDEDAYDSDVDAAAPTGPEAKETRASGNADRKAPGDGGAGPAKRASPMANLKRLWGIDLTKRIQLDREKRAVREAGAPQGLPPALLWHSGIFFDRQAGTPWQVIYTNLGRPVVVQSHHGRGSIVLAGDSYFLSNEALQENRSAALLSWIVGPNAHVVFDEGHLGVVEDVGVAALARRYGLDRAAATLLVLALLFIWQRMAFFVPPPGEIPEANLSSSRTAALEALLLRSVPPGELVGVCTLEWKRTARPRDFEKIDAAVGAGGGVPARTAYNAAVRLLRRR